MNRALLCCLVLLIHPAFAQNFLDKAQVLESTASLNLLVSSAATKKLVMLGEASHGTHEYYFWRDKISRRLIAEHEFNFVVVEGDFASLYELNRYVKHMPGAAGSAREVLLGLERWPTWMWANEDVVALAEWLREYNQRREPGARVGFYGLDVYGEWHSQQALLTMLKPLNRSLYRQAKKEYQCFAGFKRNSWRYAQAVKDGRESCAAASQRVLELVEENRSELAKASANEYFYLVQNAQVVHAAEKFYRTALSAPDQASWNSRVVHMQASIQRLLELYGADAKGIVWAHNTHIGDASYTTMIQSGHLNMGQLARRQWGRDAVFLVGFTSYTGKLLAASAWGAKMQTMSSPRASPESLEGLAYATGQAAFYRVFDQQDRDSDAMLAPLDHRTIGVIYDPANDANQYEPSIVPLRYDALVFFAETQALRPLN